MKDLVPKTPQNFSTIFGQKEISEELLLETWQQDPLIRQIFHRNDLKNTFLHQQLPFFGQKIIGTNNIPFSAKSKTTYIF